MTGQQVEIPEIDTAVANLRKLVVRSGNWQRRAIRIAELIDRPEAARAVGLHRLRTLLDHATKTVPYYSQRNWPKKSITDTAQWLREFPVMSNSVLRNLFHELISVGYPIGGLDVTRSSATTGKPTPHIMSFDEEFVFNAAIRGRIERAFKIPIGSEILDLSPRLEDSFGRFTEPVLSIGYADGERTIWRPRRYQACDAVACEEYAILGRRPFSMIYGAPSRVHDFISWCNAVNIRPKLRVVISSFEELTPSSLRYFRDFFSADVVNLYGSMEAGLVAWSTNSTNRLLVEEDWSIVEILRLNTDSPVQKGEIGRIVITSLKSWAMPIIRYDTGDLGSGDQPYSASEGIFGAINHLEGRRGISFISSTRKMIGAGKITSALKELELPLFQVIQERPGEIIVNFGPACADRSLDTKKEAITQAIRRLFGEEFHLVVTSKEFVRTQNGKHLLAINNMA